MKELTERHEAADATAKILGFECTGPKVKFKGRVLTTERILSEYKREWGASYQDHPAYIPAEELLTLMVDISEANRELVRQDMANSFFDTPEEYVDAHFKNLRIDIAENGVWTYMHRGRCLDYSLNAFMSHLKANLSTYNNSIPKDFGIPKIPSESIAPAVQVMLQKREADRAYRLQDKLAYRGDASYVDKMVKGLLECYFIETNDENIAAFKHLIWSIKRKIFLKQLPESLFYCLHSTRQHMGKTTFLRKLCTGFEWAYSPNGLLTNLLKPNDYKAMCRGKFLLDFQELSINVKSSSTGTVDESVVTALKSVISTDTISGREMYMSTDSVERQTAIFVSSTNKHIWDVINDVSGMRRYWEFTMNPPREGFDPEFYLKANVYFENITDLYQGIDENDPRGFYHPSCPEWKSMRAIQETYVRENPFLGYLHSKGIEIVPDGDEDTQEVPVRKLVDIFNNHLKERGDPPWTARHVVWVVSANRDIIPIPIQKGNKLSEIYYVKGWKK